MRDPMTAARVAVLPRTLAQDLSWVGAGVFPLVLLSRLFESPALGDTTVSWAAPALIALLATAPHARWAALTSSCLAAVVAALVAGGDSALEACERASVYGAEGIVGALLARAILARSGGATTPLAFAGLLISVSLLPPALGATIAAALRLPAEMPDSAHAAPLLWLGNCSADSFATLALFPLAFGLRRHPPQRMERRDVAVSLLLAALVFLVTTLSVLTMARPFAFCSLVLGMAALVAGPRTRFLAVWICLASAASIVSRMPPPDGGFDIAWIELNLFLPGMAIALPIQVLSVALERIRLANDVLRDSRERFRRLYDNAPVMLQSLDEDGRTTGVNAHWLATLGYNHADDVRGAPFERFLMPDGREGEADTGSDGELVERWHRRLLAAQGQKLHLRLRTAGGYAIHTLASAASAPDTADAPGTASAVRAPRDASDSCSADTERGIVLAFEDISVELAMREELERERDQLAALTSATSDLAFFIDRDLRYRSVNRAFERIWETTHDAVQGRRPAEVAGQEGFAVEIATPLARALAGEASRFQSAVAFPGGPRVMEVALSPAYDAAGARAGVVATLHDVTERVEAAQELRQLVEDLQHANEGLQQFARIAAHDLREPLNTISQFGGLIEEDYGAQLPPDAMRWFELMRKASARMKAMLDDVLQFVRLERPSTPAHEVVPLDRVFADLRVLLHARMTASGATLAVEGTLPSVFGQASLVELLFQNLLINAMRYTAPGIQPRVEVTAERIVDLVVVTLSDNGVGIPPVELERIFAPFHRLQTYRQAEGSGLGLAICRRIAQALGGRVWAESDGSRGSRLRVALRGATGATHAPPAD